jgi:hypothetical protein
MRGMVAEADSWLYPSNWSNGPGMKGCFLAADFCESTDKKKFLNAWHMPTVPQTDTGAQVE